MDIQSPHPPVLPFLPILTNNSGYRYRKPVTGNGAFPITRNLFWSGNAYYSSLFPIADVIIAITSRPTGNSGRGTIFLLSLSDFAYFLRFAFFAALYNSGQHPGTSRCDRTICRPGFLFILPDNIRLRAIWRLIPPKSIIITDAQFARSSLRIRYSYIHRFFAVGGISSVIPICNAIRNR